jgi:phage-related minor tail protein
LVVEQEGVMDHTEEFEVKGDDLLSRVKELIAEGNVRRLTIKNSEGKTLLEIPLTIGVVGALIAPVAAAIGAVAALVTECTISVTREVDADPDA